MSKKNKVTAEPVKTETVLEKFTKYLDRENPIWLKKHGYNHDLIMEHFSNKNKVKLSDFDRNECEEYIEEFITDQD
jgi:hypothetical protein